MAANASQSVQMWIPPQPGTGAVEKSVTNGTLVQQADPLFVQGFTCQNIATGTAGLAQTDV